MYRSEITIRVRYGETDRMGYVYYGNYAQYFEVARVEALRKLGFSYKALEDSGILLPAYTYSVKFLKPAYYDDELIIKTVVPEIPMARIRFEYETFNQDGSLINRAETTLVFINKKTEKPCSAPDDFNLALRKYFE